MTTPYILGNIKGDASTLPVFGEGCRWSPQLFSVPRAVKDIIQNFGMELMLYTVLRIVLGCKYMVGTVMDRHLYTYACQLTLVLL